jgi:hypothetical protein
MSAKNTMKTFFAAMNEQMSTGGYGPKIKTTPMGPFRWNDRLELWENVNNGMLMNNVTFQDMFIMDMISSDGGPGKNLPTPTDYDPTLSGSFGTLTVMGDNTNIWWAATSAPTTTIGSGNLITFSNFNRAISVTLTILLPQGLTPTIYYSTNGSSSTQYTTALTLNSGDKLEIGLKGNASMGSGTEATGTVVLTNTTRSTTLATIDYDIIIP